MDLSAAAGPGTPGLGAAVAPADEDAAAERVHNIATKVKDDAETCALRKVYSSDLSAFLAAAEGHNHNQ